MIFYRTASCGYCKHAASYMQQKGIAYSERDVQKSSAHRQEFNKVGAKGVPTFVFGKKTVFGFNAASFDRAYAEFKGGAQR